MAEGMPPAPNGNAMPAYQCTVPTEPSSPSSSEDTHASYPPSLVENGYHGLGSEEDSIDDADSKDVPLDFSIRKRELSEGDSVSDKELGHAASPLVSNNTEPAHEEKQPTRRTQASPQGNVPANGASPAAISPILDPTLEPKIGEPQIVLPGVVGGAASMPALATTVGMLPGIPSGVLPAKAVAAMLGAFPAGGALSPSGTTPTKGGARPFKAYPKDPLSLPLGYFGIPGVSPMPNMDIAAAQAMSQNSEEMFRQYRDYVMKMQDQLRQQRGTGKQNGRVSARRSSESSGSASPAPAQGAANDGSRSPTSGSAPRTGTTGAPSRKRGRTLPDEQKDEAYWERRRKNNDAAKRSRDSRRAKEDEIAIRAAFLEQENLKLRVELAALKNETAKLRCMLYNS